MINFMKSHHFLLIGLTGLLFACGEMSQDEPSTILAQTSKKLVKRDFDPEQIKRGEAVYLANCTACHGKKGEAGPDWRKPGADGRYPPPPLNGTAHTWHHSTAVLKKTILEGGPPGLNGLPSMMPAWQGKLSEQQVDDVLVWIKSLWPDEIYDAWYRRIEKR